jgi:hypothetical protein
MLRLKTCGKVNVCESDPFHKMNQMFDILFLSPWYVSAFIFATV